MKLILLFIISFTFLWAMANSQESTKIKILKDPVVIDVRTQGEFDAGHIDNAILIPFDIIKDKIDEYVKDKTKPIAIYCRSGRRSGIAKSTLIEMGFKNVENYGSMQNAKDLLKK